MKTMYFFVHSAQGYKSTMEDMRRQMDAEMKEIVEKSKTAAKIMIMMVRESWRSGRQKEDHSAEAVHH